MQSERTRSSQSASRRKAKPGPSARSTRVLSPSEEAILVNELCRLRKQVQRALQPLLRNAPEGHRLDHFDQQVAYYQSLPKVRAATRKRIEAGLEEYNQIKHQLVLANVAWVTKLSRNFRNATVTEEDLFQDGICGLLKAIDRFEAKRGLRLMTYATWYIREAMQQVRARQSHTVSLSAHDQTLLGEIESRRTEFQHQHQRQPSQAELGKEVARKPEFLHRLQTATSPAISLDRNATEGTIPVAIDDPSIEFEHNEAVATAVSNLLSSLPYRERFVVTRRFGLEGDAPASLEVLGGLLKVSKERVRQLQRQALRRMQQCAEERQLDLASV